MTLLEVVVSAAILAVLALMLMSATVPLSDTSSEQAASLDMDRDAGKFMAALRRELRQSGMEAGGTPRVRILGTSTLELYLRQGPGQDSAAWRPDEGAAALWTAPIRYTIAASAQGNRNAITRAEGGLSAPAIENVQAVTYTLETNSNSLLVVLTLARRGVKPTLKGGPPSDLVRVYTDRVEMMNRASSQ